MPPRVVASIRKRGLPSKSMSGSDARWPVFQIGKFSGLVSLRGKPMIETGIVFVGDNFLMLTRQPLLFAGNGVGKG